MSAGLVVAEGILGFAVVAVDIAPGMVITGAGDLVVATYNGGIDNILEIVDCMRTETGCVVVRGMMVT